MDFLSKNTARLVPYTAGEQPRDKKYIKLNTNENPYPPSPRVAEALAAFDIADLRRYPDPESARLAECIAKARGCRAENVFLANGSDEVLAQCFKAFFDADGDAAAFADVTYSFYPVYCALYDIRCRIVPLRENFVLDVSDYDRLKGVRGIVIANPNAPSGRAVAVEEIEGLLFRNPDKLVIVDEAYADFAGQSAAPLLSKYENLIVVQTFSKSYSLAGIRCGYALAQPQLVAGLKRVRDSYNSYPVDALCQNLCAAAILDTEYYRKVTAEVVRVRNLAAARLTGIGCKVIPSDSNFLFVRPNAIAASQAYQNLKDQGILVRYFQKKEISEYLRITVGTAEEMERVADAMSEWNG